MIWSLHLRIATAMIFPDSDSFILDFFINKARLWVQDANCHLSLWTRWQPLILKSRLYGLWSVIAFGFVSGLGGFSLHVAVRSLRINSLIFLARFIVVQVEDSSH